MRPQLLSGARGKVVLNSSVVLAFVTDISIDAPHNVRPIHTFGSPSARSVEPLSAGPVTVTLGRVIPVNKADGTPVDSSAINTGIEPTIAQMLSAEDITIDLIDKITGTTYLRVPNPKIYHARALELGAKELSALELRDWGDLAAYSLDPDGHVLVFSSQKK